MLALSAGPLASAVAQQASPELPAQPESPSALPTSPSAPAASDQVNAAPVRHLVVSWKQVSGAIRYQVLIRPLGGDISIDRSTTATSIHVVLKPGTYQVRVISYNIFDKPASETEWHYLEVIEVFRPEVSKFAPKVLYSGLPSATFDIDGNNFLAETSVELLHDGTVVARAVVDEVAKRRLVTHFNLTAVPPGRYDLRLGNPEHLTLLLHSAVEVRPRIQPGLSSLGIPSGYNDRIYRQVGVSGTGFIAGTTFFLEQGGRRIDIPSARLLTATKASLDINLGDAAPGVYALVVANPGGLSARLPHALTVERITTPKFVSMTPSTFVLGKSSGSFVLRARDLIPEAQVYWQRKGSLLPALPNGAEGGSAARAGGKGTAEPGGSRAIETMKLRVDLSHLRPGRYDLVIKNSLSLTTVVPGVVEVKPTPPPRFIHPRWIEVTVGYPFIYGLSPSFEDAVTGSDAGGDVAASFPLGVMFFPHTPFARDLSLELELGDSYYTNLTGGGGTSLNLTTLGTSILYRSPFRFPINALVRVGYGLSYSLFHLSTPAQTANGSSMDFFVRVGAGAELDLGKWLAFQLGAEWMRVLYAASNFDSLRLVVRAGVRLGP